MLEISLDDKNKIAILKPNGALSQDDFKEVTRVINPFIEKTGKINGIIVYTESFPGWDSFMGLLEHLKFIKEHHKKISYVAFVTDSPVGEFAEDIGNHFVSAEVKNFSFNELEDAKRWILEDK